MSSDASVLLPKLEIEASLSELLAELALHDEKSLVIEYGNRRVQPGYHVTEIKAGSFVTLDCGGNPDAWHETILQVEDISADKGQTFMSVGKFRAILEKVSEKVSLDRSSRLTFEISGPHAAMQVFDVSEVITDENNALLRLTGRAAICKPRHRAERSAARSCCTPSAAAGGTSCCT